MKTIRNPDDIFVKNLRKRIKANNNFCVCKQEKKPDNKCPCKDFRDGHGCDCGLYVDVPDEDDPC